MLTCVDNDSLILLTFSFTTASATGSTSKNEENGMLDRLHCLSAPETRVPTTLLKGGQKEEELILLIATVVHQHV